ncbi:NADPH--cytochrome P450 reductase [Armadillidium nasatum]|uniref:NADPH--hemoprotein reductase n=1 Tax=Armadillidium nasatum TaxID=96803 RepID=A0A5N5SPF0_9CRUS|nr:NADPH--cytochrome P450 reductase [Armadillidium nasatum]
MSNTQYLLWEIRHMNITMQQANLLTKKLRSLEEKEFLKIGLGDDDANMEDDFITWKDNMWPKVCELFGLEASTQDINMRQYELKVHEEYDPDRIFTGEIGRLHSMIPGKQRPPFDTKNPFMAEVTVIRELHRGGDRNCMHIELNIEGSRIRYDAGDHVAIFPINDPSLVEKLCKLVGEDPDKVISLLNLDEDSTKKVPFPCPCSYKTALMHYVDIQSVPRTHVLKEIAEYASDPKDKEKLQLLSSTSEAGKAEYQKWVVHDARNIIQILEDLPSCKPPLDHLCELLPRLQARYYSISSTPKVHPNSIHVTAVVLKYETSTGRTNKGVCTNWLYKRLEEYEGNGKKFFVPIFVRKSQFRLPNKPSVPVLMIGPGTGIAPFRGFLQERSYYKNNDKEIGKTILYFGCRYKQTDFIYEDELKEFINNNVLKLYVAFSREQEHKVYVTHLLEENKEEVWDIIGNQNGHLYVCGDAKNMARDVHNIITKICETQGNMTPGEAEMHVKKMVNQRRYSSDVWS